MRRIVLFDGDCNFCNGAVNFIIKRDRNGKFKFASLQSPIGEKLQKELHVPLDEDSLILIEDADFYTKSAAALRICKQLDGLWKSLFFFIVIPSAIRDLAYKFIAKYRYKLLGNKSTCAIPPPHIKKRFLS